MNRPLAKTGEWDTYYAWDRFVHTEWEPDWGRFTKVTGMAILWEIVRTGHAGLGCGIGDQAVADLLGIDRSTVWRYRRFFLAAGILAHSGARMGRVKMVDIAIPASLPQGNTRGNVVLQPVPEPANVVLQPTFSPGTLPQGNTNKTLITRDIEQEETNVVLGQRSPNGVEDPWGSFSPVPASAEGASNSDSDVALVQHRLTLVPSQENVAPVQHSSELVNESEHAAHRREHIDSKERFDAHPECEECRDDYERDPWNWDDEKWAEQKALGFGNYPASA